MSCEIVLAWQLMWACLQHSSLSLVKFPRWLWYRISEVMRVQWGDSG